MKNIWKGYCIGLGIILSLATVYFVLSVIGYSIMGPETVAVEESFLREYLKGIQR